jgi:hypothetical protein
MVFINENLSSPNLINREAALSAIGAVLASKSEGLNELVLNSMDIILEYLRSPVFNTTLKFTAAWALQQIAKGYSHILASNEQALDKWLADVIDLLSDSSKDIIPYLCDFIAFLFQEGSFLALTKHINYTLDTLFKLAMLKESFDTKHNISYSCFFTIDVVIQYAPQDCQPFIHAFCERLVVALKNTLEINDFPQRALREHYQDSISHLISCGLMTSTFLIDEDSSEELYNIIASMFKQRSKVTDSGMAVISELIPYLSPNFDLEGVFTHIQNALKTAEVVLCKQAIFAITYLIKDRTKDFIEHKDNMLPAIIDMLEDQSIDRSTKPSCLNVIADTMLYCPDAIIDCIGKLMPVITILMEDALNNPYDLVSFINF